jgi:hypothetical protein
VLLQGLLLLGVRQNKAHRAWTSYLDLVSLSPHFVFVFVFVFVESVRVCE